MGLTNLIHRIKIHHKSSCPRKTACREYHVHADDVLLQWGADLRDGKTYHSESNRCDTPTSELRWTQDHSGWKVAEQPPYTKQRKSLRQPCFTDSMPETKISPTKSLPYNCQQEAVKTASQTLLRQMQNLFHLTICVLLRALPAFDTLTSSEAKLGDQIRAAKDLIFAIFYLILLSYLFMMVGHGIAGIMTIIAWISNPIHL